jgi:hypothetical protein
MRDEQSARFAITPAREWFALAIYCARILSGHGIASMQAAVTEADQLLQELRQH